MANMNAHLQTRYRQYDMLANLDAVPSRDFVVGATATVETPLATPAAEVTGFGPSINGGTSLDLHLAAFNDDLATHGDDLFLRMVRVEVTGFADIAADIKRGPTEISGRVRYDATLDARMSALGEGLRDFDRRAGHLNPAQLAVTDESFDQ
ncbi:hypothetical protein SAMN04488239_101294 [Ruegeria marina]|uniref:Uncharacterized protein n=1 Tax=Ruegeria marina TaxID=639004 RepID=A0A1G6J7E1_9RHOB|nr:hypothetical protein SAMN04488239_101294 [Ruegeria marina]